MEQEEKTTKLSDADIGQSTDAPDFEDTAQQENGKTSRRRFIAQAGKTIAYAAPMVLLFKPKEAIAASGGGSAITPG